MNFHDSEVYPAERCEKPLFFLKAPFWYPERYARMKEALPSYENVPGAVRSHRDLYYGDPEFARLRENVYWNEFCEAIHGMDFWRPFLDLFDPQWRELGTDPRSLKMRRYCETRKGGRHRMVKQFLYPRIDIGYGIKGYGIETGGSGVHRDMVQRLISILWYFSDQKMMKGGEFEVYENPSLLKYRIPVSENLGIISLQSNEAWHAVNPVTEINGHRIAVYLALSSSFPLWSR